MSEPIFLRHSPGLTIREIAALTGAAAPGGAAGERRIDDIAALERAGPSQLALLDNARFVQDATATRAGACFASAELARAVSFRPSVTVLIVDDPYEAFAAAARALFPHALRPSSMYADTRADGAQIDASARLEQGVTVEPGAIVGPRAGIGSGTIIAANAVIGAGVQIGRDGFVGAGATVAHALLGDRVVVHAGCHIGQGGLGEAQMPRVGRVIIQDGVEIGAGTTIDRGVIRDTVIGEGTKIDNLVRVGQNASIGRHCVLAAQAAIACGAIVEDHTVL